MEPNDDTKRDVSTILTTQVYEEDEGAMIIRDLHATYEIDENTKLKIDENDYLPDDLAIEAHQSVQLGAGKRRVSIAENVTIYETSVADTNTHSSGSVAEPTGARKDLKKIMLLIFLYTLQGIPMGLATSIPYLLSSRGFSYADQGTFSFAFYPYSIKILWAPFVDALFIKRFGRRKSWLVPIQFLVGILLFSFSHKVDEVINKGNSKSDIMILTGVFLLFTFLAATQDVALDGWALSMLSKENLSWQGTCNYTGLAIGFVLGNPLFILMESTKFSNKYFRPIFGLVKQSHGLVTMQQFMVLFAFIFFMSTMVLLFINEEKIKSKDYDSESDVDNLSLTATYKVLWKMLSKSNLRKLMLILFTFKIGWATDNASFLKYIEFGVTRETMTLLMIPTLPFIVLWPSIISRYTKGTKSILFFTRALPIRLLVSLLTCAFLFFMPSMKNQATGEFGIMFYLLLTFMYILGIIVEMSLSMSMMSFFSNISDESVGGTYMTFLTTVNNLGGSYPGTTAMYLISWLSVKLCSFEEVSKPAVSSTTPLIANGVRNITSDNACQSTAKSAECRSAGGICVTTFDAYFYLSLGFLFVGFIWLLVFRRMIRTLRNAPNSSWKLVH